MSWGKDDNVKFLDRWNPLSSKIPYTTFTSHILVRRKKVTGKPHLDIETVVPELERAVQEYRRAHGNVSLCVQQISFALGCFWGSVWFGSIIRQPMAQTNHLQCSVSRNRKFMVCLGHRL